MRWSTLLRPATGWASPAVLAGNGTAAAIIFNSRARQDRPGTGDGHVVAVCCCQRLMGTCAAEADLANRHRDQVHLQDPTQVGSKSHRIIRPSGPRSRFQTWASAWTSRRLARLLRSETWGAKACGLGAKEFVRPILSHRRYKAKTGGVSMQEQAILGQDWYTTSFRDAS